MVPCLLHSFLLRRSLGISVSLLDVFGAFVTETPPHSSNEDVEEEEKSKEKKGDEDKEKKKKKKKDAN